MRNIGKIYKIIILFILLVNIVDAQIGNNAYNTGFAKDLVVYLPVSKVIDGINDAVIDISMQNPSNETMYVEINVVPPSNIYIYGGQGFIQSGNGYMGAFIVDPGKNNTVEVRIKSDKTGTYSLDFNGQYWFGTNPSRFNIKNYSISIEVKTPSINAKEGPSSPVTPIGIPDTTTPQPSKAAPDISIGFVFMAILTVYIIRR